MQTKLGTLKFKNLVRRHKTLNNMCLPVVRIYIKKSPQRDPMDYSVGNLKLEAPNITNYCTVFSI